MAFSVHLAGSHHLRAGVCVGADTFLQPPTDRQVVGVFTILGTVIFPLQRSEVEHITTPGVTDLTVITWRNKITSLIGIFNSRLAIFERIRAVAAFFF